MIKCDEIIFITLIFLELTDPSLTTEREMSSVSLFSIISTLMESDFMMFHVTTRSQSSVRQDEHPPEIILYFHILFYFIT